MNEKTKSTETKPKKKRKATDRKSKYTPAEREKIREIVTRYFGATVVEKQMLQCQNTIEIGECLKLLHTRMQKEIEAEKKDLEDYYKQIDLDYKKVGRPKSVFNWKECAYLCSIGCTQSEVAGFFGVKAETLTRKINDEFGISWAEYYDSHSQGMKVSIRRAQIRKALEGDSNMLKFLGKNTLGQKDKVEFDGAVKTNSFLDLVNNLKAEERGFAAAMDSEEKSDAN